MKLKQKLNMQKQNQNQNPITYSSTYDLEGKNSLSNQIGSQNRGGYASNLTKYPYADTFAPGN